MQSVYSPYDLSYTPLVPQHILVNSPQVGSQLFGFDEQDQLVGHDRQILTPIDYEQYADMNAPRQHDSQSTGLEQQLHGMSLQQDISAGPDGDYFHEGAPQFQPRQQAPPQHQFGTEPLNNGAMNGNSVNGGFEYAQMVPGGDFNSAPSRTVYLGNVPQDITAKELLDHVRSGVVENMRILPEKMCAFISFLDESSALLFHSDAILKRLTIKDNDIKIGWGRNVPLTSLVLASVQRDGATRNVYIGSLPKTITEEQLRNDLSGYGIIDTVKILQDKGVAFVHFCSIASAIKVVTTLGEKNEFYADKKIFYGKDRCAFITKTQQHNAAQYLGLAPDRHVCFITFIDPIAAAQFYAMAQIHGLTIHNKRIKIGWGKHSGPLSNGLTLAVSSGPQEHLHLFSKDALRKKFSEYGDIEQINFLLEKNCVFVNFTSISNAFWPLIRLRLMKISKS
ncbi:Negative regulator of differentiation 1 [Cyberlindnera fabianii]|uniref:Negative regulator of differentiation 1 n=1 Tax=Cyberlindnera fabianii TaxID=36022 RepID=A0A1V2L1E1_CYBFA|nr:Negative regulator of differentiation 1 [Cyberlindnera fabianii]